MKLVLQNDFGVEVASIEVTALDIVKGMEEKYTAVGLICCLYDDAKRKVESDAEV